MEFLDRSFDHVGGNTGIRLRYIRSQEPDSLGPESWFLCQCFSQVRSSVVCAENQGSVGDRARLCMLYLHFEQKGALYEHESANREGGQQDNLRGVPGTNVLCEEAEYHRKEYADADGAHCSWYRVAERAKLWPYEQAQRAENQQEQGRGDSRSYRIHPPELLQPQFSVLLGADREPSADEEEPRGQYEAQEDSDSVRNYRE